MKKTPFYEFHKKLGARMVEFAGYEMPIQYEGIIPEHLHVREKAGLFDVSHMGRIIVKGEESSKFINYLITNDISTLKDFTALYTVMCLENGGIIDDLLVYRLLKDYYLLVINAANHDKDLNWIKKQAMSFKTDIIDTTLNEAQLALQGPLSENVLQNLTDFSLSSIEYYTGKELTIAGKDVFISRTGYTGEDGFELYFDKSYSDEIFSAIIASDVVKPIGLGARDTLRLEMKFALYGNDITEETNPIEAGLSWVVKLDKPDFIGRDALIHVRESGIKRRLVAFEMLDKSIPRHGYIIISNNNENLGIVTSGTFSPSLRKGIGLGYVKKGFTKKGTQILIQIKHKLHPAVIIKPPFYKGGDA